MTRAFDPADQAKRRRRARISQAQLAARLNCAISKVSEYETGKGPLPWEQTPEDYERELAALIAERANGAA
jgi:transcriptional regulator with XRE-family HTH domain